MDLDGTLLRRDGSIHPDDIAAIRRAKDAGVHVSIATGRLYSGSLASAVACAIDGAVACADGSHIHHVARDEKLFYRGVAGAHAAKLRAVVDRDDLACFVFASDGIVHDAKGEEFLPYVRTWSPHVESAARATRHAHWERDEGITAVVAIGSKGAIDEASDALREELDGIAFVVSFPISRGADPAAEATRHAMVVRAAGVTKGTAIEFLAEHHGVGVKEVVVVGDWINDIPMFQIAGRAFVMKQAPKGVKMFATDHLDAESTTGGGVAEAIKKAWGI